MAKAKGDAAVKQLFPEMVVVHEDPADDVRLMLDAIGASEEIAGKSLLSRCVWLLEQHGTLTEHGYRPNANVGPIAWRALVAMMRVFDSADQWVMGDLVAYGRRWADVHAVDRKGDMPLSSEDGGYDPELVEVMPFGYDQAIAVTGRSRQTLFNWAACCRRFPDDPESPLYRGKPEWRGALFSAFYELMAHALPYEFVDLWLRRAAQPVREGGASIETIREEKRKLLAEMRRDAEGDEDAEVTTEAGTKKYVSLTAAKKKWGTVLALQLQAKVPELGDEQAEMAAEAALSWVYADAPDALLDSALHWTGSDDDEED